MYFGRAIYINGILGHDARKRDVNGEKLTR